MNWVYALICEDEVYYIGTSRQLHIRLTQHFNGSGSRVTQKYKPKSVLFYKPGDAKEEHRVARYFRKILGHKVYGGPYNFGTVKTYTAPTFLMKWKPSAQQ